MFATVNYSENTDGSWTATHSRTNATIDLGNEAHFNFYASDSENNDFTYSIYQDDENSYALDFSTGDTDDEINMSITADNANAVPAPAAAWILGAGLLGLMGYRMNTQRNDQ